MEGITKPGPVNLKSGNIGVPWKKFHQKFEIFLMATGKKTEVKWATLTGEAGDDVFEMYTSFRVPY